MPIVVREMSTLRSALDELRSTDVFALSDEQLASDLDELEHATRVIEVERGRRVAELERRGAYARDGHLSLASWLASRHRVAPSMAAGHVRMARALEAMPVAAEALAAGDVSSSAVSLLAHARDASPEAFSRSEESLVDAARTLSVDHLKDVVARWRHDHADDAADDRQELYLSPTLRGRGRLSGDLNAETTQVLITALRACRTRRFARATGSTPARPPVAGPTPWGRSAASGSTPRAGRPSPGSVRT